MIIDQGKLLSESSIHRGKMRIIVGISGASGAVLGVEVLKALHRVGGLEVHLVASKGADKTLEIELKTTIEEIKDLADVFHPVENMAASIASGSFRTEGMIIAPCSMKTLAGIASGFSNNLLLRAADVCLKERRKLVLVPRETPLSGVHLRNLLTVHQEGGVILPAIMSFYSKPETIQDMMDHLMGKILMQFDLEYNRFRPWQGM